MNIALYSDCHSEMRRDIPWFPDLSGDADCIVLAGDIGVGHQAIAWVSELSALYPALDIIYVAGNHEYYQTIMAEQIEAYRGAFKDKPRIHFLENDSVVIQGIRFLGCTLWSDFKALGKERSQLHRPATRYLADFQLIKMSAQHLITLEEMAALQGQSVLWLMAALSNRFEGDTVVVTHFPPVKELLHGLIGDNELAPYFLNDLEALLEASSPKLWCYGHNHWNDDREYADTRIVSNQLGYPNEDPIQIGYRPDLIISV